MTNKKPRSRTLRNRPQREPYERVLIVCGGEKTEPNYFGGLMDYHRLSTANIEVVGQGTDPSNLVEEAIRLQENEQRTDDGFDRVYCV